MALSRIDITVGLYLPRLGDVRLNQLLRKMQPLVGAKMPKIGEKPIGRKMSVDPPTPGKGERIDVRA
jgi:hypothetical protein